MTRFQLSYNDGNGRGVVIVDTPEELWKALDSLLVDSARYIVVSRVILVEDARSHE